jgi:hypothetical protein
MYKLTNDGYEYFAGMYNADNPNSTVLFDAMSDNLDISITKTEVVDENTANVYAHIKTINMYNVLDDIVKTENPTDSTISDAIEKHSADYVEKDTVFNFIKQDGKWVIESNLGIYSDLSGGYLQYMYEVSVLGMTGEQAKEKYNGNNQQN